MKKIILSVAASCMLLIAAPHETMAREKQTMKTESSTSHEQAQKLIGRLHEIKEMDKTKLSPAEKSKLHKEVLSIRDRLMSVDGGIYISGGVLVLIIVLFLILR